MSVKTGCTELWPEMMIGFGYMKVAKANVESSSTKAISKWMEITRLMPDGSWRPVYRTEGAPVPRTSTDPIFFGTSDAGHSGSNAHVLFLSLIQKRFLKLVEIRMLSDLRSLWWQIQTSGNSFYAFMILEGLDVMSVAQNLAANNRMQG